MVSIDVRLKKEDVQILQSIVGKKLDRIEHDEFVFTNTSSQAVKFDLGDALFYLYSFTEPLDYFGAEEDVAVWSVEEKEYPLIADKNFVTTPIQEKIAVVRIVQEHQMLFENAQQTYDGKIYAVPLNIAAACCYYNKDIFEEAGVEVPTTYEELLDTCAKIKEAGYTPITISAGTAWCLSMLAGYLCDRSGVDLAAINAGDESWVQDKTIAAGEKLLELSQYFQETAAGDSNDDATMAFAMGDAAILIQGSWAIGQMNAYNPDIEEKCGVFQFPAIEGGGDPGRTIAKSDSLAVSATSKCPEGAVELIKYFTDDEAQKYTAEVGGKIPVTNVEFDLDVAPAQLADVMDVFSNATGTFGFYNESLVSSDAGSEFDNEMVAIFQQEKTPEEAFQAVEDWYAEEGYR